MRYQGHNVLAIVVAALAIYAIGFVLYGLIISPEQYEAMVGLRSEQMHPERMPLGVIAPILTAIGLSLAVKWRKAPGWMGGATTGLLMAVFIGFAMSIYPYVYGAHTEQFLALNLGDYLVTYAVAGAILGAWK